MKSSEKWDASLFPASTVASVQPPEMGKRPDFSIVAAAKTAVVRKRS
jgi:hypothetical protein